MSDSATSTTPTSSTTPATSTTSARHHIILPTEILHKKPKHPKPYDLLKLRYINVLFADLDTPYTNTACIDIEMGRREYPEYWKIFGTADQQTPDQQYHRMIEQENRGWWETRDGKQSQTFASEEEGRLELYSVLAADIENAKLALEASDIEFNPRTKKATTKALLLFWRMQWHDRPGLKHLCERSETEEMNLNTRYNLFVTEKLEVRTQFLEILKQVANRLWKTLGFRKYTRKWSLRNGRLLRYEQFINVKDMNTWVQDLTAEMTIEVISKIGIVRALQMVERAQASDTAQVVKSAQASESERECWINKAVVERLDKMLEETAEVLKSKAPGKVFRFGTLLGLQPGDVVDVKESMFSPLMWVAPSSLC